MGAATLLKRVSNIGKNLLTVQPCKQEKQGTSTFPRVFASFASYFSTCQCFVHVLLAMHNMPTIKDAQPSYSLFHSFGTVDGQMVCNNPLNICPENIILDLILGNFFVSKNSLN